jgi:hypothetical protein
VAFGEGGVNYRCQRFVGISFQYPKGFLAHFEVRSALGIFGESGSLRLVDVRDVPLDSRARLTSIEA